MRTIITGLLLSLSLSAFASTKVTEYGADWCPVCRIMKKILAEEKKLNPSLEVEFINVDTTQTNKQIQAIPYMVVTKDGKVVFEGNVDNIHKFLNAVRAK